MPRLAAALGRTGLSFRKGQWEREEAGEHLAVGRQLGECCRAAGEPRAAWGHGCSPGTAAPGWGSAANNGGGRGGGKAARTVGCNVCIWEQNSFHREEVKYSLLRRKTLHSN